MADLPPLPEGEAYAEALRQLVTRVNGFVYSGDRLNAVVDTIKVLRSDPLLTRTLLLVGAVLEPDPVTIRRFRRCTCGEERPADECGARGFACMGPPHQGGCRLPAGHEPGHDWQREEVKGG